MLYNILTFIGSIFTFIGSVALSLSIYLTKTLGKNFMNYITINGNFLSKEQTVDPLFLYCLFGIIFLIGVMLFFFGVKGMLHTNKST